MPHAATSGADHIWGFWREFTHYIAESKFGATIAFQLDVASMATVAGSDLPLEVIACAIQSPSSHNTQPWLFRLGRHAIELHADRRRALPVVDPEDRALTISCGAALLNLRLALRRAGYAVTVETSAAKGSDLLVKVHFREGLPPTRDEERLAHAISLRHTNRHAFEDRSIPEATLAQLAAAARMEDSRLTVISPEAKDAAADLIAEGDRIQASDAHFRRELAAWVRPNGTHSRDGIPADGFGVSNLASLVFPFVLRTFDWGNGQAARDRQLALGSPVLAILSTAEDTVEAWLAAGQALQRVLLTATANGVSASFLNQPVEVPSLRPQLAQLCGLDDLPQLLLRFGYGPVVPHATPRREIADVVIR